MLGEIILVMLLVLAVGFVFGLPPVVQGLIVVIYGFCRVFGRER